MSGRRPRRALAQLVGGERCEAGLPGSHSGEMIKVFGMCQHGHEQVGDEKDPSTTVCVGHWWAFASHAQDSERWLRCRTCEHDCDLHVTAQWPDGRAIRINVIPELAPSVAQWPEGAFRRPDGIVWIPGTEDSKETAK